MYIHIYLYRYIYTYILLKSFGLSHRPCGRPPPTSLHITMYRYKNTSLHITVHPFILII